MSCAICERPVERATKVEIAGEPTLERCTACDLVSLQDPPSAEERAAGYQEAYYDPERGERFLGVVEWIIRGFRSLRVRDVLRHEPGPASLLDVGCGRGLLLDLFQRRGWRVLGTQLSATAARAAREQRGVDVVLGELTELDLEPESFRVVTFYHVLEHLARPGAYLRRAHDLLEDDGFLLVEVPNYASPGFRVLGTRNLCVDYPHHLHFFTPKTLRELLVSCGFEVVGEEHFSPEYSPITTLQNLLNLLPGRPNRFLDALRSNPEADRLRREGATWLHALFAAWLGPAALVLSLAGLVAPVGNTLRIYARKRPPGGLGVSRPSSGS